MYSIKMEICLNYNSSWSNIVIISTVTKLSFSDLRHSKVVYMLLWKLPRLILHYGGSFPLH